MINIPKGTKDVLPNQSYKWQYIEETAREVARAFNFKEVRTPVFEHTELFQRGVGETTDVVNKEMYTFEDKGGRSITLKPEGTAGVVRLFLENGLASSPLPVKAYYITPAFRYERPQAGRLREFHQFGLEVFGSASPETDAEVILAAFSFLNKLGLKGVKLQLNSIGCPICRNQYNTALKNYFRPHLDEMCPTCRSRFDKNPLRILDCKEEGCKKYTSGAPEILDYLCDDCKNHFEKVKSLLDSAGVEYTVNSRIVRGLDYYTKTVFEFVSTEIGAQGTVCGGGRYDGLIGQLGGNPLPAIGFAAGIERILLLMENTSAGFPEEQKPLIYIAGMDETSRNLAFKTALELRGKGVCAEVDHMGRSVKAQFKYADKISAKFVAVIGENEVKTKTVNLKKMSDGTSKEVKIEDLSKYLLQEEN
ncbi:MAG: histidine--tRNA ligase [Clostridia bacterium]|jgi:histidyl-tRNA synthetase|nr:histidine--tRNA ligase [Clostridia bacterium]